MSFVVRREIVGVCRDLWERGLITAGEGNVSVRQRGDRILLTPRGRSKRALVAEELVELSLSREPDREVARASTEWAVHLHLYRARTDITAVVHAHPPAATGFAAAGQTLAADVLPEVTHGLGPVVLIPYERPGTAALAERVAEQAATADVFLLANHGAVTVGASLQQALQRMESLEHAARILLVAHLLGGPSSLRAEEVAALMAERQRETGSLPASAGRRQQ